MCGISGIINKSNVAVTKDEIKYMNDLIVHRGPDDEGFFYGKNFALGHRRLSILDLSKDGHQPMSYMEDKYTITYNGEIFNYLEIRKELEEFGYKFNSKTDTEVILASYDRWGKDCVEKFNGMWAFAIYDKKEDILFCSRDRFGVKPFYFTQTKDKFVFGSEIKQLLNFYNGKFVNKTLLIDFLATGILEHTNETFFEGIYKLEQAHNMIYDLKTHNFKIKKYYDIALNENNKKLDETQSVDSVSKNLKQAIKLRLRSDVKVGTCLSGGLDSSSVAALASMAYTNNEEKFIAIHAKSIEESTDESIYAQMVAQHCDLNLQIVEPSTQKFIDNIQEVVYTQEEPFGGPSIFMQYFVMQKAKDLNCKVMLDGQGGDETLLGYEKYYPAIYLDMFKNFGLMYCLKEVMRSNKNNSKLSLFGILKYIVGSLFFGIRKIYIKRNVSFLKAFENKFLFLENLSKKYFNIDEMQKYEIFTTNLPALLRYEDKNSMRHSIETRLPFVDYVNLENSLSINAKYKIKDGWSKYVLRKVIDSILPNEVVWRKNKFGFNAPDNIWLNSIKDKMKEDILGSDIIKSVADMEHLKFKLNSMNILIMWRLYCVSVWERVYDVHAK